MHEPSSQNSTTEIQNMDERVSFLGSMIQSVTGLSLWIIDNNENILTGNDALSLSFSILKESGSLSDLMQRAAFNSSPVLLSDVFDQYWLAQPYHYEGQLERLYLLGPAFQSAVTLDMNYVSAAMDAAPSLTGVIKSRSKLLQQLTKVPLTSQILLTHELLMLAFCVTKETHSAFDIHNMTGKVSRNPQESYEPIRDRSLVYRSEQNMLRMVREGDLSYMDAFKDSTLISSGPSLSGKLPVRQERDSVIIFITLCTRAAMEGGLSPNTAYALGDEYIQAVEDAVSTMEIGEISSKMYSDFIHRVHALKQAGDTEVSPAIRRAMDYIDSYPQEDLSIHFLAEMTGYTDYYFTRKFKDEVHIPPVRYINNARINKAKSLLSSTDMSLAEITELLHFSSRSHFGEMFRKMTGMTPKEYRDRS